MGAGKAREPVRGITMTPDILWATSLPANADAGAQAARVASWGGRVQSFNDAEEAAALVAAAAEVVTVARSGRKSLGKPVPFLADILDHQRTAAVPLLGIVNADIAFEATLLERAWLADAARQALVCIRRTDVADESAPLAHGSQLPQGFDAFLYPAAMIPALRAEGFCLGMPFWDFWMPAAAALAGYPVIMVTAPVARHVIYPTRWDASAPVFMQMFVQALTLAAASSKPPMLAALLTHQVAVVRGLADLAAASDDAARLLNGVYDDFQHRILGAVAAIARLVETIPAEKNDPLGLDPNAPDI